VVILVAELVITVGAVALELHVTVELEE